MDFVKSRSFENTLTQSEKQLLNAGLAHSASTQIFITDSDITFGKIDSKKTNSYSIKKIDNDRLIIVSPGKADFHMGKDEHGIYTIFKAESKENTYEVKAYLQKAN